MISGRRERWVMVVAGVGRILLIAVAVVGMHGGAAEDPLVS